MSILTSNHQLTHPDWDGIYKGLILSNTDKFLLLELEF